MARIILCDRCGNDITKDVLQRLTAYKNSSATSNSFYVSHEWELCDYCVSAVTRFIKDGVPKSA